MNRQIKFRAWLKETKEMVTVFHWHKGDELDCIEVLVSFNGSRRILADQYDLMQFTGLKDKNGKEIYEGDIITWEEDVRPDPKVSVFWSEPHAGWYCTDTNTDRDYFGGDLTEFNRDGVVIGNIYENPELLNPQENNPLI